MRTNDETSDNSTISDMERFEKIVSTMCGSDNTLLEECTHLRDVYKKLEQRFNRLRIENSQLKTELVNMVRSLDLVSRIDGMTGLANRRGIMEKIDREATRSLRHQRPFTIMLINIDDFKKVNEVHGYNAGDDVLVEIACVLRGCIRNEDICARWGGEEFLIILTESGANGSLPVARKILESISMTEFKANKPGIHITVSIGISEHSPDQSVQECIARAGVAMQQAKKAGKNRYALAM